MAATASLSTATPSGDVLELHPGGSLTAANVTVLEALSGSIAAQLDRSKIVKVDMAAVHEIDTLGAWLLEKMLRRATSAGHHAEMVVVSDDYAGLIEEVRQVNPHIFPEVVPGEIAPFCGAMTAIGRSPND